MPFATTAWTAYSTSPSFSRYATIGLAISSGVTNISTTDYTEFKFDNHAIRRALSCAAIDTRAPGMKRISGKCTARLADALRAVRSMVA